MLKQNVTVKVTRIKQKEFVKGENINGFITTIAPFALGQVEGLKATLICGEVGKLSDGRVVFNEKFNKVVDLPKELVEQWGTDDSLIEDFLLITLDFEKDESA